MTKPNFTKMDRAALVGLARALLSACYQANKDYCCELLDIERRKSAVAVNEVIPADYEWGDFAAKPGIDHFWKRVVPKHVHAPFTTQYESVLFWVGSMLTEYPFVYVIAKGVYVRADEDHKSLIEDVFHLFGIGHTSATEAAEVWNKIELGLHVVNFGHNIFVPSDDYKSWYFNTRARFPLEAADYVGRLSHKNFDFSFASKAQSEFKGAFRARDPKIIWIRGPRGVGKRSLVRDALGKTLKRMEYVDIQKCFDAGLSHSQTALIVRQAVKRLSHNSCHALLLCNADELGNVIDTDRKVAEELMDTLLASNARIVITTNGEAEDAIWMLTASSCIDLEFPSVSWYSNWLKRCAPNLDVEKVLLLPEAPGLANHKVRADIEARISGKRVNRYEVIERRLKLFEAANKRMLNQQRDDSIRESFDALSDLNLTEGDPIVEGGRPNIGAAPLDEDTSQSGEDDEVAHAISKLRKIGVDVRMPSDFNLIAEGMNGGEKAASASEAVIKSGVGRILLYGVPGTGKTAMASRVAMERGVPLIVTSASDFLDKYIGESEKRLRRIFRYAAKCNAVMLIDEAEGMLAKRSNVSRHLVNFSNEFLRQIEQFEDGLLFAATNHMEKIDPAMIRRFDFRIELKPLAFRQIAELCNVYADVPVNELTKAEVAALKSLQFTVPADFALAKRRSRVFGREMDFDYLLSVLVEENAYRAKKAPKKKAKMGFV